MHARPVIAALAAASLLAAGLAAATIPSSADTAPAVDARTASCTTSSAGYCTVRHALGVTPAAVVVTMRAPIGGSVVASQAMTDTYTASSFRLRVFHNSGGLLASTAVSFSYVAYAGPAPSPTPTPTPTPTPSPTLTPTPTPSPTVTVPTGTNAWAAYYARWANGPRYPADVFPIGVWLQEPSSQGSAYKAIGVNTFTALWQWFEAGNSRYAGWETDQTAALSSLGLQAYAGENPAAVDKTETMANGDRIRAWVNGDEPDMASTVDFAGWKNRADSLRAAGPTRPVYGNFGKGFHVGGYLADRLSDADRKRLCDAVDIASVDVYGMTDPWEPDERRGEWVYGGITDRLEASCPGKPIGTFIETTEPFADGGAATPTSIKRTAWLAVVHGADTLQLFSHDFKTSNGGGDLLSSQWAANRDAVKTVTAQIQSYAPVLNTADVTGEAAATGPALVTCLTKQAGGQTYAFCQGDGDASHAAGQAVDASIRIPGAGDATVTVMGEGRTLAASGDVVHDHFDPYQLHVFRVG